MLKSEIIRLLEVNAYTVWNAVLCGNQNPHQKHIYERMSNPQVGDLVLETSTIWHEELTDRIGILISNEREPVYIQADVDSGECEPEDLIRCTVRIFTIRTLTGKIMRWENAGFIAVPTSLRWSEPPAPG